MWYIQVSQYVFDLSYRRVSGPAVDIGNKRAFRLGIAAFRIAFTIRSIHQRYFLPIEWFNRNEKKNHRLWPFPLKLVAPVT